MDHKNIILKYSFWTLIIWNIWLVWRFFEAKRLIGTNTHLIGVNIWIMLFMMLFIGVLGGYQVELLSRREKGPGDN